MEDRRGEPRNKPPFPTTNGLFQPAHVINKSKLGVVPGSSSTAGEWYRDQARTGRRGCGSSPSARREQPGVYEVRSADGARAGLRHGRGLREARSSRRSRVGASGGFLPAFVPAAKLAKFIQENLKPGALAWTSRIAAGLKR